MSGGSALLGKFIEQKLHTGIRRKMFEAKKQKKVTDYITKL